MTWTPLAGVHVGLLGSGRALRFTGRTLAALGAAATQISPPGFDPPPASDPYQGGQSLREERLAAWLDQRVEVVPAPDAAETLRLAAGRAVGWALVFHDSCVTRAAASELADVPIVSIASTPYGMTAPKCGFTAAAHAGVAAAVGAPDKEPLGLPFNLADYTAG